MKILRSKNLCFKQILTLPNTYVGLVEKKKRGKKKNNWSSKYPWGPFKWEGDDSKLTLQNTLKTRCQQCTLRIWKAWKPIWWIQSHYIQLLTSWMSSHNNVYEIRQKQAHSKSHAPKLYNYGNVANVTNQIRNRDSQHHFNERRTSAYSNPSFWIILGGFLFKKTSPLSGSPGRERSHIP